LASFSQKANNPETTEKILQQLDQDGDRTVYFSEFILPIFRITKAYYASIKPLLSPELKERERRYEIQKQKVTGLKNKQLTKENLQERDQNQEFQDVQIWKVRGQNPILSDDESHGLESQHVRRHQVRDLCPESQDIRNHNVRDQIQIPTGDRRCQGSNQSLRYQDAGNHQLANQIPTIRDKGSYGMQDQSIKSQDVERHQVRDEIKTLRNDESHQVRDHRQESQNVPQYGANHLNPETQSGRKLQMRDLISIPEHDKRHQVRDHSVEPQNVERIQVRDMSPQPQDLEQHQVIALSPDTWDGGRIQVRNHIPTQSDYRNLHVGEQKLEHHYYARQPDRKQILEPRVGEHYQEPRTYHRGILGAIK
jgi:hypothetical protein